MKILFGVTLIVIIQHLVPTKGRHIVCFFDSSNPTGIGVDDVDAALNHCTHFIYGYATLIPRFFTLSLDGSVERTVKLTDVAGLKKKYPHVKFLLSVGGDRDNSDPLKYLQLLEASSEKQQDFISSALRILRLYKFDGLDLAYQFPWRNDAHRVQHKLVEFWNGVRNVFKKKVENHAKVGEYKKLFTHFVTHLNSKFITENLMLTLSVLPHVDTSLYLDITSIQELFDFVHLWSFDFHNPTRNPNEADYPAPLMAPPTRGNYRLANDNVNSQVHYWMSLDIAPQKLILAIPSYGRTWQMSVRSQRNGQPVVEHTQGPSEAGEESQMSGLLSWPEICDRLKNRTLVAQGSFDYGQYIVYPGNEYFPHDTWIGYDGPNIAHYKSLYAKEKHLGGVALVDLSLDDFRGNCSGLEFPILKYMSGLIT